MHTRNLLFTLLVAIPALAAGSPPTDKVQVTNGPGDAVPVTVSNTGPIPVSVQKPPLQPFAGGSGSNVKIASGFEVATGMFYVPAGKRLIIEYFSAQIYAPAGQGETPGSGELSVSSPMGTYFFAPQFVHGDGSIDFYVFGGTTVIYAEPGSAVSFSASRYPFTSDAYFGWTVSGRLVDVN
jgi:hypothetical protein